LWPNTVEVVRLDLATYPIATHLDWPLGVSEMNARVGASERALAEAIGSDAAEVAAGWERHPTSWNQNSLLGLWWRRSRLPLCHPDVVEPEFRSYCARASDQTIRSFVETLHQAYNRPSREALANCKPYQLHKAQEAGLRIPRTLITTDADGVVEFEARLASKGLRMVYKSVVNNAGLAIPTRLFSPADRERLTSLCYAPTIFQEFIDGIDLRIAVLDNLIFCCEWRSDVEGQTADIRLVEGARMLHRPIPPALTAPLLRLHKQLGLTFGVYDFRLVEGNACFLEVNPSGQWLDMELEGGCPISHAWARKLVTRRVDDRGLFALEEDDLAAHATAAGPPPGQWRKVF